MHITSGSRTYRIPSPTRPSISRNSFQPHPSLREATPSPSRTPEVTPLDPTDAGEKGFYISFDNDVPKKPKPTLRVKRTSPKKVIPMILKVTISSKRLKNLHCYVRSFRRKETCLLT